MTTLAAVIVAASTRDAMLVHRAGARARQAEDRAQERAA